MNILETIALKRKERTEQKKEVISYEELLASLQKRPHPSFRKAIETRNHKGRLAYILEAKKASPSKGLIAPVFDYRSIAKQYEQAGAAAISCLTEPDWFLGKDEYLNEISALVSIPVLKKDFIIDPYMVAEAVRDGASVILLIAAILDDESLENLIQLAHDLDLEVLLEVHNEEELKRVLNLNQKPDVIGINNRDLKDFTISLDTTIRLAKKIPEDILCIAESGVHTPQDIEKIKTSRVNGVLIGEACMKSENKKDFLSWLDPQYGE